MNEIMTGAVEDVAKRAEAESGELSVRSSARSERRYWLHAGALGLLLLVLVPLFDDGNVIITDEGLYAAQARNIAEGSWASDRSALDVDPDGKLDVLYSENQTATQRIPYSRHPVYPLILSVFYRIGGTGALIVSSVIGAWIAAVTGSRLAGRIDQRLTLPTLWLLGAGSPLLFYSYVIMSHSLAAAACGVLLLSLVAAIDDRRRWALLGVAVGTAALVGFRSEGLLVAVACAGAVGISSLHLRPSLSIDWRRAAIGTLVLATVAVTYLVEGIANRAIAGSSATGSTGIDRKADLVDATWASLLRPWGSLEALTSSAALLSALSIVLAALALRWKPERELLPLALVLVSAGTAVVRVTEGPSLISGLFAAFPLLPAGLLLVRRRDTRSVAFRLMAITAVSSVPVMLLTMYGDGGADQWGGRFFAVLLPIVVPLSAAGLLAGYDALTVSTRRIIGAALLVAIASYSYLSLDAIHTRHGHQAAIRARVAEVVGEATQDRPPLLVASPLAGGGGSRMFWREAAAGTPLIALRGPGQIRDVAPDAKRAGYPEIVLLSTRGRDFVTAVAGSVLNKMDWQILTADRVEGTRFWVMRLGPAEDTSS